MSQRSIPPSASIATPVDGEKLHTPSADRNSPHICALLETLVPTREHARGHALEIASGTGQHITAFAQAMPQIHWHPTDIDPIRLASIASYVRDADNVSAPMLLDATLPDWSTTVPPMDLILAVNLTHLISADECQVLITQAARALNPKGVLMIYGPFKRSGALTSDGDARFDADLRGADPQIGYKDDLDIRGWLSDAGLTQIEVKDMPANNLAFIARSTEL